jgi:hypothetical protein
MNHRNSNQKAKNDKSSKLQKKKLDSFLMWVPSLFVIYNQI